MKSKKANDRLYKTSKMPHIKNGFITISMIVLIAACSKSKDNVSSNPGNPVDCSGAPKRFSTDVSPVIQVSCGTCHGTGSGNGPGALTSYTEIFNARAAIRSAVISGAMPQNGALSSSEKNSIICWIDNGAPNN